MLKDFQDAAEKAQKKEKWNSILWVAVGFAIAFGLTLLLRFTILYSPPATMSDSSASLMAQMNHESSNLNKTSD